MKSALAVAGPWLIALTLSPSPAGAAGPVPVQYLSLPGAARPLSLAAAADGRTLFVGTTRHARLDELAAIGVSADGRSLAIAWSLDVGARVNSIAVDGSRLYLATSADAAELTIVDAESHRVVGTFDAEGPADATTVDVVSPGVVVLGRRHGPGPEFYRLDVANPASVVVLDAVEDPRGARPTRPVEIPGYHHRGRLAGWISRRTPRGILYYLAVTDRDAEVQIVERKVPASFADVNGDGVYRLGCVGDSNTALPSPSALQWCEILRNAIADPDFRIVNVAVPGATVVSPNLRFDSTASEQMQRILAEGVDAVLLAFGTNDVFQGRTSEQIVGAYLDEQAVAESAGIAYFVATTPPLAGCWSAGCPTIMATNEALREAFPGHVVEFFDGFDVSDFLPDGFHLNAAGQALRAERAFAAFANPFVYDIP